MGPFEINAAPQEQRYHDQHLDLDFEHKTALLDAKPLGLTRKEYDLLALLIANAGEVVTRDTLFAARMGLQQPDSHAHARRTHSPAAQKIGRA